MYVAYVCKTLQRNHLINLNSLIYKCDKTNLTPVIEFNKIVYSAFFAIVIS